ncbi:N-acetylglucosamine/diacetylchitobiose ABC transporter substrate-binding protein [Kitasatospora sp. NBC_01287]|uniref:N-acetylglucosamine/diacetylchitobiose ABC transporter substrate-binding protein n=1 Tax=Kitasatospora sp. NBC_01287 TaxID=2903573 RepID=UPI0022542BAE|nr:N-acetylglucosamine/diacetylchitobiose ABC transporter substrate-binding protein [Kitasatospora sp. NBC_01287]MCX4748981.1 N-acetylglucosamine/diacetylchitobiose ABC transporter substrate-binding protein [Kitasatospora sp. NBC_01287]
MRPHTGSVDEYHRRDLLRRAAAAAALAAAGGPLTAACAAGFGSGGGSTTVPTTGSATNPFGVEARAPLDVVIFKGGYGDGYARAIEGIYRQSYPGATVTHLATQEISGKLQPRFNAGSPPDVIDDSGAQQLKLDVLRRASQLTDLSALLDAPCRDDPARKVSETLLPGTVEQGSIDGRMYALNYVYTVHGLWYSRRLFSERGWSPPGSWDEFLSLGATIKRSGIAPFCHQGKYPSYVSGLLLDLIAKQGGGELVARIDALDPAAWDDPAVLAGAVAFGEIMREDYLLPGTNGMTHTEAQTAWCQGRAAFIPCGSWLENEMAAITPAGFDMAFLPVPALPGDRLPRHAVRAGAGEPFVVPARARNRAGGLEFLRIMLTKEAAGRFAVAANALTVLKDGIGPEVVLEPGTRSAAAALAAAGRDTFDYTYPDLQTAFDLALQNATNELVNSRITPRQWVAAAKAATARKV